MRQLLIGDGTTAAYTNGLMAAGGVDIQKMDSNGEIVSLVAGDGIADAAQIRFVQGTAAENIVTPWISGRNLMVFDGKSYSAPVASTGTVSASNNDSTSAGTVEIKFIRKDRQPQEFFSYSVDIASGLDYAAQDDLIHDQFEALTNIPDWLNPLAVISATGTVTYTGAKNGDVAQSGAIWDEGSVVFDVIINETAAIGGTIYTDASDVVDAVMGSGDGYDVKKLEDSLMGSTYGYYNRLKLPNTPANKAVVGSTYDMYTIVATKDGSTSPQIKGVDNLMEIYIALPAGDADGLVFEGKLNPYAASANFNQIVL